MHLDVVVVSPTSNQKIMQILLGASEQSCIIYQTIKQGIPITITSSFETK
jgi:uncharacterized OsmC-like protein